MSKFYKKTILIFDIILTFGLLTHSIILFFINTRLNPLENLWIEVSKISQRFFLRQIAETVISICSIIYGIGNLSLVCIFYKKYSLPSFSLYLKFLFVQIGIMLVCTLPFCVMNSPFQNDYLFPLWSLGGLLALLTFVFIIFSISKKVKKGDKL